MKIANPAEAIANASYKEALTEIMYQLADDDFVLAYRGSEWLGLAPHIEEDVAFSSINQDTMGHAAMFYQLLEDLGEGKVDDLAHSRKSDQRKNAVLLELVNGPGHYLHEPHYDWAFAVVRNYFYIQAKKIKIESLKNSSYQPLAEVAVKVNMEIYYHLLHWKTWFQQLVNGKGDAKTRMEQAIQKVMEDFEGVFSQGPKGNELSQFGIIESEDIIKQRWISIMKPIFETNNLVLPEMAMKNGNGRNGEHTPDLDSAIETLSEVYNSNPVAIW